MTRHQTGRAPKKVIAAVANDAAASVVLSVASAIADLYTAIAQPVHVGKADAALVAAARDAGAALRTVPGSPVQALARAAAAEDVAAVVIGARGAPAGKRPAGGTALGLITVLAKPVVVVPPAATPVQRIERVLVPLDGTQRSAAALRETVEFARDARAEITVAHVHPEGSLPAFSNHLPHEVRAWSEEFIARYCPSATDARLELRVQDGKPDEHVLEILRRSGCDLVALGWSQDLAGGRAAVVRRMLAESPVPVLLTPADADPEFALAGTEPAADREQS